MEQAQQNQNSTDFLPSTKVYQGSEEIKKKYVFETPLEQIQEAERQKLLGNEKFKLKEFKEAFKHYHKVILYVNGFVTKSDEMYQYGNQQTRLEDPELIQKINNLKQTTYLNMAQIDIFNKNYQKAVDRVNNSFKVSESVKGFYRRGCAYLEMNDLDRAEQDFKRVRDLDPNFTQIEQQFAILKQKQKLADKKLQNKMQNLFSDK